jgi:transcriptional regulator with GAF, ATPase, and Fis domain
MTSMPNQGKVNELLEAVAREMNKTTGQARCPHCGKEIVLGMPAAGSPAPTDRKAKRFSRHWPELPEGGISLVKVENDLILQALQKAHGNKASAARLLGLTAPTLYYRLRKFRLD